MTDEEYTQLENLLGKLHGELNRRFHIIPSYIHDCPHIATYDVDGNPKHQTIKTSIKKCVDDIKNQELVALGLAPNQL